MENFEQVIDVQKAMGEAGGVAWCELYGTKEVDGQVYTVKINLTNRDLTGELALDGLVDAIKHAEEKYKLRPYLLKSAPKPEPKLAEKFPEKDDPFPDFQKKEPVYENVAGVLNITKIVITPGADGKTSVEFFEPGMKWKSISTKMSPEQLAGLFSRAGDYTPNHFKLAAENNVNLKVSWKNSDRLSSTGKPYKNIVSIE